MGNRGVLLLLLLVSAGYAQREYILGEIEVKKQALTKWLEAPVRIEGQNDFDVTYYDIRLDITPSPSSVSGSVEARLTATAPALSAVQLNFAQNMTVDSVKVNGEPGSHIHNDHIIAVQLDREYNQGEALSVTVYYHGNPRSTGLGSYESTFYNNKPIVWTLSEPYGARAWWPCKDIPSDKADSVDIRVRVPEGMSVASNGLLISETNRDGKTEFHWKERYPIATYLVSIAAYDYVRYRDFYTTLSGDSMPIEFFVFPVHYSSTTFRNNYARTKDMIAAFSDLFGEYPFVNEKYGHAEFLWGGGMEHQTCTSLGGYSLGLIVHELAHQWWGDMITCADFHHIWLNEGFATYSEALWREYTEGIEAYHEENAYNIYKGPGSIYVYDDTDVGRIFNYSLSYAKGSYVLHMLRGVVGDSVFFRILRSYYDDRRYQYGVATTEQFQEICEDVSGLPLGKFFRQWIYGEYYPQYRYDWTAVEKEEGGYELRLYIEQTQRNTGLFWMPVDIAIDLPDGRITRVVWDSLKAQEFVFHLDARPVSVSLDPDNWILKDVEKGFFYAALNPGTLLVNGVNLEDFDMQMRLVYKNIPYWNAPEIHFWDQFEKPVRGYPEELPEPIGNGQQIPLDLLRAYSTIIWLGNNEDGDISVWKESFIDAYLKAGGNVLLVAPFGRSFIYDSLKTYAGLTWKETLFNTISGVSSAWPGLLDMPLAAEQNSVSVFDTVFTDPDTRLVFTENESFAVKRGVGFWKKPAQGGYFNIRGGQFAYIGCAPFALEQTAFRANIAFFMEQFTVGTAVSVASAAGDEILPQRFEIARVYPNPFNPVTTIELRIPREAAVRLSLFNVLGQQILDLTNDTRFSAGVHKVRLNGAALPSGLYVLRLDAGPARHAAKLLLMK